MAVDIHVIDGKSFVWNANDACMLREKHRIVGNLVGCLPRAAYQNTLLGLPLQLIPEEAHLLSEKGIARVIAYPSLGVPPSSEEKAKFNSEREKSFSEQSVLYKEAKKQSILKKADDIFEGKRKKMKSKNENSKRQKTDSQECEELDKDKVIAEELKKVDEQTLSKDSMVVQIFCGCPNLHCHQKTKTNLNFPNTVRQKLRYEVFKDLWEKGYYLTGGSKFGGDFLVYPGDPLRYHASFVATCVSQEEHLTGMEMITKGRLATTVNKTALLCSFDKCGNVAYLSLEWTGM